MLCVGAHCQPCNDPCMSAPGCLDERPEMHAPSAFPRLVVVPFGHNVPPHDPNNLRELSTKLPHGPHLMLALTASRAITVSSALPPLSPTLPLLLAEECLSPSGGVWLCPPQTVTEPIVTALQTGCSPLSLSLGLRSLARHLPSGCFGPCFLFWQVIALSPEVLQKDVLCNSTPERPLSPAFVGENSDLEDPCPPAR